MLEVVEVEWMRGSPEVEWMRGSPEVLAMSSASTGSSTSRL